MYFECFLKARTCFNVFLKLEFKPMIFFDILKINDKKIIYVYIYLFLDDLSVSDIRQISYLLY